MISVLILTKNEAQNLPRCMEALAWSDDIVVLDSESEDDTLAVARDHGARTVTRPFDNWALHQTWAVRNIPFKHPWVYYSDADEIVTPALRDEMLRVTGDATRAEVAYRVRRKDHFMGRWIRHAYLYPTWFVRLFRPEHIQWVRPVHPPPVIDGPVGDLESHFLHYPFSKGLEEWRDKHLGYAGLEARQCIAQTGRRIAWRGLLARDGGARRIALKALSYRLPLRPLLRFVYMYVWRRGFLDGYPGYRYCRLVAWYERMIDLNVRRLRAEERSDNA